MIAFSLVPHRFEDGRHEAMHNGLRRCGYDVRPYEGKPGSVLIVWNLHSNKDRIARDFESKGGKVIVAEEAYFRVVNGEKHFALALGGHNGSGRWNAGGPERWESFNIPFKPWREKGTHIIVRSQRGIGSREMASPPDWHTRTAQELRRLTKRPVVIREHHKIRGESVGTGLDEALVDCHAVVTWASSIAPRSIVRGVPAFVCAPHSIAEGADAGPLRNIETPAMPDRLPTFQKLAWAQWSLKEIASGEAFAHLLKG
jgi:hypothetical protein